MLLLCLFERDRLLVTCTAICRWLGQGLWRDVRETAFDFGTLLDCQRIVMHVALDFGRLEDDQFLGADRSFDPTGKAGGVGKYTRAKFTHVDSGPLRDWGR